MTAQTRSDSLDDFQELADKTLLIAHSVNQLNDEYVALLKLPALNKKQSDRLATLNSALHSFDSYLSDLAEFPTGSWIKRALKAA